MELKLLSKKLKPELVKLCKDKKLDVNGTKKDLVQRLLDATKTTVPVVNISKTQNGQYCHSQTGLVFDPSTKRVIGKYNDRTGATEKLSRKDIDKCNDFKFRFSLPETLEDDRIDIYDIIEDTDSLCESDDAEDDDFDDVLSSENEEF